MGTCTVAEEATNIDHHWISKTLTNLTSPATVELNCDLSPHRPVWARLYLQGGYNIPVQVNIKLPKERTMGPSRAPQQYE